MDYFYARCSAWLRAAVVVGISGLLWEYDARQVRAQPRGKPQGTKLSTCPSREVRSRHFLLHTDLPSDEAEYLVERLESMLGHISTYWGQPLRGAIECYVIRNPDEFPQVKAAPAGIRLVKTVGGVTLMQFAREGNRQVAKSVLYASPRLEIVKHEAVHAYCHQTFGRIGPIWYSEGMAEAARFWNEEDTAVRADPREIKFLRNNPPKSLAEPISSAQVTGDSWQNYASRWALCHFLTSNPNYSRQFRQLGRSILAGKDVAFEQTYAAVSRQLFFEYLFFLRHIESGYRVDLCAWNWKKKSACLPPGRVLTATIAAGRGWQPTGLTVRSGTPYEYLAAGAWQVARSPQPIDADGDDEGRGRLVGVLMKDFRLGAEFELGSNGTFQLEADGDLYLRCRNAWNELADDSGQISVKFQLRGRGPSLREAGSNASSN